MSFANQRVLVTGAGGFIGSHLVEELVRAGAEVTALVHYNSRSDWGNLAFLDRQIRDNVEIVFGDVRDPFSVHRSVRSKHVVFHLAALIGIPYSYHAPQSYVETNVHGTLNVMQAALESGVGRVVHTSTSEVYGSAQYVPIDENHPLQPQSPYSASKVGADGIAWSYFCSFDLPVAIMRPFNTFGPRQSARAIIPTILSQLVRKQPTLHVGSLAPIRDFNYVKDTVAGFMTIAQCDQAIGEVINVGSGVGVTMRELVDRCCAITLQSPQIVTDDARVRPERSEVMQLLCDNSKAQQVMGWQSRTALDRGLLETLEFVENHPHLFDVERYAI